MHIKTILLAGLLICGSAVAGPISWTLQDTGVSYAGLSVALAMRSGYTWPVMFGEDKAVAMLPSGWTTITMAPLGAEVRAASSPTGQVAAVSAVAGRGVLSSPAGWASISANATTFDSQGRLWTAKKTGEVAYLDNGGWQNLPKLASSSYTDITMAVADNGDVGAVTMGSGGLVYHHYSSLTSSWTDSTDLNTGATMAVTRAQGMAFDTRSIPHMVGLTSSGMVEVFDFDITSGKWRSSLLPSGGAFMAAPISMVSDRLGGVGVAYVASSQVFYANNTGAGWSSVVLPITGGVSGPAVGLAYDYAGIPAIGYAASGRYWLAYDPPVPEPTSMLLLMAGAALLRRKR